MHWLKPENDCKENPEKRGAWRRRENLVAWVCSGELDVGKDKRVQSIKCLVCKGYKI